MRIPIRLSALGLALGLVLAAPGLRAASAGAVEASTVERIQIAKPMTIGLLGSAAAVSRIELRTGADGALGKDAEGREPVLSARNPAYTFRKEGTYQLKIYGNPWAFDLGFFWGFDKTNAKYGFRITSSGGPNGKLSVESQSHSDALRDAEINRDGLLVSVP
jgi:hypothetical protein